MSFDQLMIKTIWHRLFLPNRITHLFIQLFNNFNHFFCHLFEDDFITSLQNYHGGSEKRPQPFPPNIHSNFSHEIAICSPIFSHFTFFQSFTWSSLLRSCGVIMVGAKNGFDPFLLIHHLQFHCAQFFLSNHICWLNWHIFITISSFFQAFTGTILLRSCRIIVVGAKNGLDPFCRSAKCHDGGSQGTFHGGWTGK